MTLSEMNYNNYQYLFVSTTAKHSTPILRLPDRELFDGESLNLLITDEVHAIEVFKEVDGRIPIVVIDAEVKQDINLFAIAQQYIRKSAVYTNKPNDLTMESADILLQHHFSQNIVGKKILVIGTGNIAFKLALRLAERNAQVFIDGRDKRKISRIVETINMVIPIYSKYPVQRLDANLLDKGIDAIVPFVSAEKVVSGEYAKWLKDSSISIDGGIGNFSEGYIAEALIKQSKIIRLDVRIGLPFAEASLTALSPRYDFFQDISGEDTIEGIKIVAGGIIGPEGTVIVDRIKNPHQIIGIANGYGGVKHESTISAEERRNIEYLRECFE